MDRAALQAAVSGAVAAHSQWKSRLTKAVEAGSSEFTVAVVQLDNQCAFGRWLYAELPVGDRKGPHYEKVRTLHATFHETAARVLSLALAGRKAEAQAAMTPTSDFGRASGSLTLALMAWQQTGE